MPRKSNIDLLTYPKNPRRLSDNTMDELGAMGMLHPILEAVAQDPELRLDIRDGYFNVYYGGGSLLRLQKSRQGWEARFDEKYFRKMPHQVNLPSATIASAADTRRWVKAFPALIKVMDDFWTAKPNVERRHCQEIARANSGRFGTPPGDYLILDIEYQWAHRRFDLIAARKNPRMADPEGWSVPKLVFVEVKSKPAACKGSAGLYVHAQDYASIVGAGGGCRLNEIRGEYESVIRQKENLELIDRRLGFERFSVATPEFLLIFVDLNPDADSQIAKEMEKVRAYAQQLPSVSIHKMFLTKTDLVMTKNNRKTL